MHQARGNDRALFARVGSDGLAFFEKQKRRQRAARLDAIRRDELRDIEDVNGGKLVSSASAGSIQASAELVVPRSMPTFMISVRSSLSLCSLWQGIPNS